MTMTPAEQLARKAHEGQFRFDGVTPYIKHPEAVAESVRGYGAQAVAIAWLHDVLEDTSYNAESMRKEGISEDVIMAVGVLSKRSGEDYGSYLMRVRSFPVCCLVKIHDILHNLSDSPSRNQVKRYAAGLKFLLEGVAI